MNPSASTSVAPAPWTTDGGLITDARGELIGDMWNNPANARLVAAAPGMLFALQGLRTLAHDVAPDQGRYFADVVIKACSLAIDVAEGRLP